MNKIKLIFVLIFTGIVSVVAQKPMWIVYDTANSGISNNIVWSIVQDAFREQMDWN